MKGRDIVLAIVIFLLAIVLLVRMGIQGVELFSR